MRQFNRIVAELTAGFKTEAPGERTPVWIRLGSRTVTGMNRSVWILGVLLSTTGAAPIPGGASGKQRVGFVDVTARSGISFRHVNAATGRKYLVETMGPGCAFVDYDRDGYLDLYLVNGQALPGFQPSGLLTNQLYRNNGDGTFTDVTEAAGVEGPGYGMGVAVGDYDNDGFPDLYVTNYGPNLLYRNNGNGTFTDVSRRARVDHESWGASAAFFDYDRDGDLDLYVTNYVAFDLRNNPFCGIGSHSRSYCHPDHFNGVSDVLYRNDGDGSFSDVTREAGVFNRAGKGLGLVAADFNRDGYQDLYVANDSVANFLYLNQQGRRFSEVGFFSGSAYSGYGEPQAGMGVATADYDGDGWADILVTNLSLEGYVLYRNETGDRFADVTFPAGIGAPSLLLTGWGTGFFDYDNDGDQDLIVTNGHVIDNIEVSQDTLTYLQPKRLFENHSGKFTEVTGLLGNDLVKPAAGRGLALGDYDNDGDVDVLVTNCNQPPNLLRNDGGNDRNWLQIRPRGRRSNRDGVGVVIRVTAGDRTQVGEAVGGSSYLSTHDRRLHFGLGRNHTVDRIEIQWPSGAREVLTETEANQLLTMEEPE